MASPDSASRGWRLGPWTADDADRLISQTASQLKALEGDPLYSSVYGYEILLESYGRLADAEQEALWRFPEAPQAVQWRWDLAYNQSLGFVFPASAEAPELTTYGSLMADALNTRAATPASLPMWFAAHESRLDLVVAPLASPASLDSSALVSVGDMAYFWVVERAGTYRVQGLLSNIAYFREAGSGYQVVDLTGDGFDELVLTYSQSNCCGFATEQTVFDFASGVPERLEFAGPDQTAVTLRSTGGSEIRPLSAETPTDQPGLVFDATYGDPYLDPCPVREHGRYVWASGQFVYINSTFTLDVSAAHPGSAICRLGSDLPHSEEEASVVARALGDVYEESAQHVLALSVRFRLSQYLAERGQTERARALLQELLALAPGENAAAEAPWKRGAQQMLDGLASTQSFYAVCAVIPVCDPHGALEQVIAQVPPARVDLLIHDLAALGVDIRFDRVLRDPVRGAPIRGLVVRDPHTGRREYWVALRAGERLAAQFVADVATDRPQVVMYRLDEGRAQFGVEGVDGPITFTIHATGETVGSVTVSTPVTLKPVGTEIDPSALKVRLDRMSQDLYSGGDPAQIRQALTDLRGGLDCTGATSCARIDYLLAMISERLGDSEAAIAAYLKAWRESTPDSFVALWVRLKLTQHP